MIIGVALMMKNISSDHSTFKRLLLVSLTTYNKKDVSIILSQRNNNCMMVRRIMGICFFCEALRCIKLVAFVCVLCYSIILGFWHIFMVIVST